MECMLNNFTIWSLSILSVVVSRNFKILVIIIEVFVIASHGVLEFTFLPF